MFFAVRLTNYEIYYNTGEQIQSLTGRQLTGTLAGRLPKLVSDCWARGRSSIHLSYVMQCAGETWTSEWYGGEQF